jgi:hypothetical protein
MKPEYLDGIATISGPNRAAQIRLGNGRNDDFVGVGTMSRNSQSLKRDAETVVRSFTDIDVSRAASARSSRR